jgi:hypothetical protein
MTHREPEALVRELEANGLSAATGDKLAIVAEKNGVGVNRLLGLIFMPD